MKETRKKGRILRLIFVRKAVRSMSSFGYHSIALEKVQCCDYAND